MPCEYTYPELAAHSVPRSADKTGPKEPEQQWRLPRTRYRNLLKLGINPKTIKQASRCRKGYWHCSRLRVVDIAMNKAWLAEQGCPSITEQWLKLCYPNG